jgi:uncharacterized membrane protein
MPDLTPWFLLLFVGVTTVQIALAVPLMLGRIPPNALYGLRTTKSLSDEGVWYASNTYAGQMLFRTGLVQLVAIVALYFVPILRVNFIAYNLACLTVMLGGVIIASVLIIRYLKSL